MDCFRRMAKLSVFCYDIHARNVVLKNVKSRSKPLVVKLIDFDDTFCIPSQRIVTERSSKHRSPTNVQKSKRQKYYISTNNLFVSLLIVFANNTREKCGQVFFREKLNAMLAGDTRYLAKGGGRVDLNLVLRFLKEGIAEGNDSTMTIMRWWNAIYKGKAMIEEFCGWVLGRHVPSKVPVPWQERRGRH